MTLSSVTQHFKTFGTRAVQADPNLASDGLGMFRWQRGIPIEQDVQHAIRDLVRFGDVAFDVGAHRAGLSTVLSRCVGPRGVVCSFEASPRNIAVVIETLVANGCGNATVFHGAVGETSGERVGFYFGAASHSDTMHPSGPNRAPNVFVETIALDDVVEESGLEPAFVKMDIEGNEPAALRGFARTLDRVRPTLVVEVAPSRAEVVTTLTEHFGYRAMDLQTYRTPPPEDEVRSSGSMMDVLFTHPNRVPDGSCPYAGVPEIRLVTRLDASMFCGAPEAVRLREPHGLPPGRYIVRADFDAGEGGGRMRMAATAEGAHLALFIAPAQVLWRNQREFVIDLPRPCKFDLRYEFPDSGSDPAAGPGAGFAFRGVEIFEVEGFPMRRARSWLR